MLGFLKKRDDISKKALPLSHLLNKRPDKRSNCSATLSRSLQSIKKFSRE